MDGDGGGGDGDGGGGDGTVRESGKAVVKPQSFANGDIEDWIQHYELCCRANRWEANDGLKLLTMATHFRGRALAVYSRLRDADKATYPALKTAMIRAFAPDTAERRRLAHQQYVSRRWKSGESMEECARALERLLDKAMPGITEANRHRELITKFSELMSPEVAYQLSLQTFATFEECLMRAQELDLLQSRLRQHRVGMVSERADRQEEEIRSLRRRIAELEAGRPRREGPRDNAAEEATPSTGRALPRGQGRRCFGCGEIGHLRHECPKVEAREKRAGPCFECGEMGHLARDCEEGDRRGGAESQVRAAERGRGGAESRVSATSREVREVRGRGGRGRGTRVWDGSRGGASGSRNRGGRGGSRVGLVRETDDEMYDEMYDEVYDEEYGESPYGGGWYRAGGRIAGVDGSLTVRGEIDGEEVDLLVDTGAKVSLIPKAFAEAVEGLSQRVVEDDGRSGLHAVNDVPLDVMGRVRVNVRLGSWETWHVFYVAELGSDTRPILGFDFLRQYKMSIQTGTDTLVWGDHSVPTHAADDDMIVVLRDDVKSDGMECKTVIGEIRRRGMPEPVRDRSQPFMLEPSAELMDRQGVLVGRGVTTLRSRGIPVEILFPAGSRDLPRGTVVGRLEAVRIVKGATLAKQGVRKVQTFSAEDDEKFLKLFDLEETWRLPKAQRKELHRLLLRNRKVFSTGPDDIGRTDVVTHQIDTGSAHPIRQPARRLPHAMREEVDQQVEDMLRNGIIQPSSSPWSAPVILVQKKDGTYRFCVDYRALNEVTVRDSYPLPRIDETLESLGGAEYFSTLDMASGYWQVLMRKLDKEKTAFTTGRGHYEFNVMPFGLTNAPATFQRLMEYVLAGLQWEHCLIYLDDIIVFAKSFEEQLERLQEVLDCLYEAGLKLKPSKCHLVKSKVDFLGHVVSRNGLSVDPRKVEAITKYPRPQNLTQLRQFLGLSGYYRRFIKNYSTIAAALFRLERKEVKWDWTEACDSAFESLKQRLVEAPILAFPRFDLPFSVATDASGVGVGATLSQVHEDGGERVVAYWSRALRPREQNYSVTEREAYALVWAVTHYRPYLLGRCFKLITDHCPLTWLKTIKDPKGRLARWILILSEFDWDIEYKPGRKHSQADALSRQPLPPDEEETEVEERVEELVGIIRLNPAWTSEELADLQQNDVLIGLVLENFPAKPPLTAASQSNLRLAAMRKVWHQLALDDGVLYRFVKDETGDERQLLVVPKELQSEVLRLAHEVSGHFGVEKTLARVKEGFWWPGYTRAVEEWVAACGPCARKKARTRQRVVPLHTMPVGRPFETLAMDFVGPVPETERRHKNILVVTDYYTKWVEAFPTRDQQAVTVAKLLVNEIFARFGMPTTLHSDQGRNFESSVIKEVCKLLRINKSRTTAYHPQGDGLVERFNKTMVESLTKYVHQNPNKWDLWLPLVLMAYRTAEHASIGRTPFELVFGRKARLPADVEFGTPTAPPVPVPEYVEELEKRHRESREFVEAELAAAQARQTYNYDSRLQGQDDFELGQRVWLYKPKGPTTKFSLVNAGPYEILRLYSNGTADVRLLEPGSSRTKVEKVHRNRLAHCTHPPRQAEDLEERARPRRRLRRAITEEAAYDAEWVADDTDDDDETAGDVVRDLRRMFEAGERASEEPEEQPRQAVAQGGAGARQEARVRPGRDRRPPDRFGDFIAWGDL